MKFIVYALFAAVSVFAISDENKCIRNSNDDSRSPCPMLNSLANHGFLPRNGRNISEEKFLDVLINTAKLGTSAAQFLVGQAMPLGYERDGVKYLDLENLQKLVNFQSFDPRHNAIEHDASLSRIDAALGNSTIFNQLIFDDMYSFTHLIGSEEYISARGLGKYRKQREIQSRSMNKEFVFGASQQAGAYAEAAVLLLEFKDETGDAPMKLITPFFEQECLPFDQGWDFHEISFKDLLTTAFVIKKHSLF